MDRWLVPLTLLAAVATCPGTRAAGTGGQPPGEPESTKTGVLETGAGLLQRNAPPEQLDIHLVGLHPMLDDPSKQFLAHHYCHQLNEDLLQCALYDGDGKEARLTGIEYIISERLYATLPEGERQYWHPHNAEILSGQLAAPGLPAVAEKELMRGKLNSYGKTWHLWDTGRPGAPNVGLPLGPPMLAWSFNREGEADPALVQARDQAVGTSTEETRRERQDLVPLAKPQLGVDRLEGRFGRPTQPIPGVVEAK
jgi:hypothetical protein